MTILEEIRTYRPECEQERIDREKILTFLEEHEDAFLRSNEIAHMTSSGWILSPDGSRVAMVYHNIYQSWSWIGGHADGETDLLAVAIREAEEETGLKTHPVEQSIFSLEILPVDRHIRKGKEVPAHLHLNVTYLLQAEREEMRVKPDENSAVRWLTEEEAVTLPTEKWMVDTVYRKLIEKSHKHQ